ncbi:MAG TPA: NAD(P)/FAD-dependent oxidoreductase [Steroidobacteraceae bacterium]|nr:NAD(P)/FAD-dependent oxidoreductase [Steroidobacteraceae bacterium]
MEDVDVVVCGAGVVGLAVARELALAGREVLILEAAERAGGGISSRNSEVIHAGLYYPPGSLKARLCVSGRELLYAYCRERAVGHRRCGKLIVATAPEELSVLETLAATAAASDVALTPLSRAEALALEPELSCLAALHSPLTGIVDAHGLMLALLADAEAHGATLACRSPVTRVVLEGDAAVIAVGDAQPALRASLLVNCAGLGAPALAAHTQGLRPELVPRGYLAKGSYFALAGRAPFTHLVYPLPRAAWLGIHLTLDLTGAARFGPDLEWCDAPDYRVDPGRAPHFTAAIRRYWPRLPEGSLTPAFAGVRPKISGPGEPAADFRIDDASVHGCPAYLGLYGIESPGLTASLALAREVVSRIL